MTTETTNEVAEVTQQTVKEVSRFAQYIQDNIPTLIGFGIRVLLALVFFFIGRILIKWIRKIVRRSIERSSADKGVALQGSLSNFAGGVLILLLKPFEVGDYIIEDSNGKEGTVKEIQIFYTKLSTIDNKTIVIPNGMLTNNSLTNATAKDERRLDLKLSISYSADLKKAKMLIEIIIRQDESILKDDEIVVFVDDLADSAVVIGARAWVKNEEFWPTKWRLLETIKLTLDEHGVEIPYPQLTVHMPKGN